MNIKELIELKLDELGKNQNWLAEKLKVNLKTLNGRLNRNSFTWDEFLKVAYVLGIDLNEIKNNIMEGSMMKEEVVKLFEELKGRTVELTIESNFMTGTIVLNELFIQKIEGSELHLSDNTDDPEVLTKMTIKFSLIEFIKYNEHANASKTLNFVDGAKIHVTPY